MIAGTDENVNILVSFSMIVLSNFGWFYPMLASGGFISNRLDSVYNER